MILGLDLNSPAELRARDDRRSMSVGGKDGGKVIVVTKTMRKRKKRGERRTNLWPQQNFDHTRHPMVRVPGRVHYPPASVKSSYRSDVTWTVDTDLHRHRKAGGPEVAAVYLQNFSRR